MLRIQNTSCFKVPVITPRTQKRRYVVNNVSKNKKPGKSLKLAEAIAGRSSMYGTVFGGANWALTGLDVIDQVHYLPFTLLAVGSSAYVTYTMLNAEKKLTKMKFEEYTTIGTGRLFMLIFSYMLLQSLLN
jgi:hypothetical protein